MAENAQRNREDTKNDRKEKKTIIKMIVETHRDKEKEIYPYES